jgi:hypothetical protein
MSTLFTTFSVKGNLKFYKTTDEEEKVTISIGVNANHQLDNNLYEKLSDFLEQLLINDYITEDQHNSIKIHEKQEKTAEKQQLKYIKDQEKLKKKMKVKVPKVVKKVKSLY